MRNNLKDGAGGMDDSAQMYARNAAYSEMQRQQATAAKIATQGGLESAVASDVAESAMKAASQQGSTEGQIREMAVKAGMNESDAKNFSKAIIEGSQQASEILAKGIASAVQSTSRTLSASRTASDINSIEGVGGSDRAIEAAKVSGRRAGAVSAIENIELGKPEVAQSIVSSMLARVAKGDRQKVHDSMKNYGLVADDSTAEDPKAAEPAQFLAARAAMRASAMGRDDRMQAAGYSFNVTTDAFTGESRVEASKVDGLTVGQYYHNKDGARIDNPIQAAGKAAGIDSTDAFMDNGEDGGSVSGSLAGNGVWLLGGAASLASADATLFKGAARKAVGRKIGNAAHDAAGHIKGGDGKWHNPGKEEAVVDKDGKEEWISKDEAKQAASEGWVRNEDGKLVHPDHLRSSSFLGGSVPSDNSLKASYNPPISKYNNPPTTKDSTLNQNSITSPSDLVSADNITSENKNVKKAIETGMGLQREAIEGLRGMSTADVAKETLSGAADTVSGSVAGAADKKQAKARGRIAKILADAAETPQIGASVPEKLLSEAGMQRGDLEGLGLRFDGNGGRLDIKGTGEAARGAMLSQMGREYSQMAQTLTGIQDVGEAASRGSDAAHNAADAKRMIAEQLRQQPPEVSGEKMRQEVMGDLRGAAELPGSKGDAAARALNRMEAGQSVSKKLLEAAGINTSSFIEGADGRNVDFASTGKRKAINLAAQLENEADMLSGKNPEGLGKEIVKKKIGDAVKHGGISQEAGQNLTRAIDRNEPVTAVELKQAGIEIPDTATKSVEVEGSGGAVTRQDGVVDFEAVGRSASPSRVTGAGQQPSGSGQPPAGKSDTAGGSRAGEPAGTHVGNAETAVPDIEGSATFPGEAESRNLDAAAEKPKAHPHSRTKSAGAFGLIAGTTAMMTSFFGSDAEASTTAAATKAGGKEGRVPPGVLEHGEEGGDSTAFSRVSDSFEQMSTSEQVAVGAMAAGNAATGVMAAQEIRNGEKFSAETLKDMAKIETTGAKAFGKSMLKKLPLVGLAAGAYFGAQRLENGDVKGAMMEFVSGALSMIPGVGTAASVGIDASLAARDLGAFDEAREVEQGLQAAPSEEVGKAATAALASGGAVKMAQQAGSGAVPKEAATATQQAAAQVSAKISQNQSVSRADLLKAGVPHESLAPVPFDQHGNVDFARMGEAVKGEVSEAVSLGEQSAETVVSAPSSDIGRSVVAQALTGAGTPEAKALAAQIRNGGSVTKA